MLIDASPCQEDGTHETVRMTVGLTLRNPDVYLFLLSGAMEGLQQMNAPADHESAFRVHLSAFLDLGCPVIVEREALPGAEELAIKARAQIWSREEIILFVSQCQTVIVQQGRSSWRRGPDPFIDIRPFYPDLSSWHEDRSGLSISPGDPPPRILHLLIHDQGELFREVIHSQRRRHQVTVVLSQNGSPARGDVAEGMFEVISEDRGDDTGHAHRRIDYGELLDLIFQHETVICW